ncbi:unnamed protein product [Urochloa humidicola]
MATGNLGTAKKMNHLYLDVMTFKFAHGGLTWLHTLGDSRNSRMENLPEAAVLCIQKRWLLRHRILGTRFNHQSVSVKTTITHIGYPIIHTS